MEPIVTNIPKKQITPPKKHYVNNKELFRLVCEHQADKLINPESTLHMEAIASDILKISTNISYCHKLLKFRNYFDAALFQEFIMDGVINSLRYMHNFDPNKGSNIFAYYSQICYNAILRGVIRENKKLETIRNITERISISNTGYAVQNHDVGTDFCNTSIEYEMSKIDGMG